MSLNNTRASLAVAISTCAEARAKHEALLQRSLAPARPLPSASGKLKNSCRDASEPSRHHIPPWPSRLRACGAALRPSGTEGRSSTRHQA
jgi:hypothetical protein